MIKCKSFISHIKFLMKYMSIFFLTFTQPNEILTQSQSPRRGDVFRHCGLLCSEGILGSSGGFERVFNGTRGFYEKRRIFIINVYLCTCTVMFFQRVTGFIFNSTTTLKKLEKSEQKVKIQQVFYDL